MITFNMKYEKDTGKCLPTAQIAWEPSWPFQAFEINAKPENGDAVLIKKIMKRSISHYEETLDVGKLAPGTRYQFIVSYQDSSGSTRVLDKEFIKCDTVLEIPYTSRIFYYDENLKSGWKKIYILIDKQLPEDCIRVLRNKHEYSLPNSLSAGKIYVFRFKAQNTDIKLKTLVRTTQRIERAESLEALYDKCNFGGNGQ